MSVGKEPSKLRAKIKKAIGLSSITIMLLNQLALFSHANAINKIELFNYVDDKDISTLKKLANDNSSNYLISNILNKGYKLNAYEVVILSSIVDSELKANNISDKERNSLLEIQNRLKDVYREVFQANPDKLKAVGENAPVADAKQNFDNQFGNLDNFPNDNSQEPKNTSLPSNERKVEYQKQIDSAATPEELVEAMSVINIRREPSTSTSYTEDDDINPYSDFFKWWCWRFI